MGIVPTYEMQTFPCPQCRATVVEGRPCKGCGLEVEPAVAAEAAAQRTRYIEAFAHAHSLVITARSVLLMLGLSLLPIVRLIGLVGFIALLVWVPGSAALWFKRYATLKSDDPEYPQVRGWVRESIMIWLVALVASFAWYAFMRSRTQS